MEHLHSEFPKEYSEEDTKLILNFMETHKCEKEFSRDLRTSKKKYANGDLVRRDDPSREFKAYVLSNIMPNTDSLF